MSGVAVPASDAISGTGFPTDEGRRLALHLLSALPERWDGLEVDLRGMPPALLIGGFFFAFLQTVHEREPARLPQARSVRWLLDHRFQERYVADWMDSFRPN